MERHDCLGFFKRQASGISNGVLGCPGPRQFDRPAHALFSPHIIGKPDNIAAKDLQCRLTLVCGDHQLIGGIRHVAGRLALQFKKLVMLVKPLFKAGQT